MGAATDSQAETVLEPSPASPVSNVYTVYKDADPRELGAEDKVMLSYLDAEGYETPIDPDDISVGPEYTSISHQLGGGAIGYAASQALELAASHPALQEAAQAAKEVVGAAGMQYPESTAVFALAMAGAYGGMRWQRRTHRQEVQDSLSEPADALYERLRDEHDADPLA